MKRLLIFFLPLIMINCRPTVENNTILKAKIDKERKTEILLDSIQKIPINTNGHSFIKIIPHAPHLIWHFNSRNILEIINTNYPDSILSVELPAELKGRVFSKNDIFIDHFTKKDIYFCSKQLYYFNIDSNKFIKTPIKNCGYLKILKNHLVAKGWQKDLVILNKSTQALDTIYGFKKESLNHVTSTARFGLVINNHQYNLATKEINPLKELDGVFLNEGINNLLVQDSLICYAPGRSINIAHAIVKGKHYPKHFIAYDRVIENESLWTFNSRHISKWDLSNNKTSTFKINFPGLGYRAILNDNEKYWIIYESIYSFNRTDEKYYSHKTFVGKILQVFLDEKRIYVLDEKKLSIYSKAYLEQKKSLYDIDRFVAQKKHYLAFIDSIDLKRQNSYQDYEDKVNVIEDKFKEYLAAETNHIHLDVFKNIWNNDSFRQSIYLNYSKGELDSIFIKKNYYPLINSMFVKGELTKAFKIDSLAEINHGKLRDSLFKDYRYKSNITALLKYKSFTDSLSQLTKIAADSLAYQKALGVELISTSSWFCHEGYGGCDLTLLQNAINNFIKKYPKSTLTDDAAYKLIALESYYDTGEDETYYEAEQVYLNFLKRYPQSSKSKNVITNILYIYNNRDSVSKVDTDNLFRLIDEQYEHLNEDETIQKYRKLLSNKINK